jgi:hypothetical protein
MKPSQRSLGGNLGGNQRRGASGGHSEAQCIVGV